MKRRELLQTLAGAPAASLLVMKAEALVVPNAIHCIRCLGAANGPRYLDGRTHNGTVGLVRDLVKPYSGTKWQLVRAGEGIFALKCRGDLNGPRWLDGRTHNGTIGLAPEPKAPYTGTRWHLVEVNGGYVLKCLGALDGPRYLDGRTQSASVGLAAGTAPPFTGTRWEIRPYPVCTDEPCSLP